MLSSLEFWLCHVLWRFSFPSLQSAARVIFLFLSFIWWMLNWYYYFFLVCVTSQASLIPWILVNVASGHGITTVFTVTKIKVTWAVNQEKSAGVRGAFPGTLHKWDMSLQSCCSTRLNVPVAFSTIGILTSPHENAECFFSSCNLVKRGRQCH